MLGALRSVSLVERRGATARAVVDGLRRVLQGGTFTRQDNFLEVGEGVGAGSSESVKIVISSSSLRLK